ncbi:putative zinc finger protein [Halopolyspora algeriensis]|uniref:Putative zinc finger protein n=1 Tax=Halopolyspora algeriensis TaxID=1500506 RepID=A0A368VAN1_9ACTN|nr:zf-HC2 domain-containing protein [Halopolyspora algeriensis]RCW38219.1 putative zinc finger protein [Halopolyspora algeriensis]TQM56516.1 putative zinc finger protein [Halopolyspora algeriensis]
MDSTDHEDVRGKLDSYFSGHLDDAEWSVVRAHLAECEECSAELTRPVPWRRAAPQRVAPQDTGDGALTDEFPEDEDAGGDPPDDMDPQQPYPDGPPPTVEVIAPPGWPVVFGTALVAALVAFGLGYAVATIA